MTKKLYLKWRDEFLKYDLRKTPENTNPRIKIKIQVDEMMYIIKEYFKSFNEGHRTPWSIKKILCSSGQDQWGAARLN